MKNELRGISGAQGLRWNALAIVLILETRCHA